MSTVTFPCPAAVLVTPVLHEGFPQDQGLPPRQAAAFPMPKTEAAPELKQLSTRTGKEAGTTSQHQMLVLAARSLTSNVVGSLHHGKRHQILGGSTPHPKQGPHLEVNSPQVSTLVSQLIKPLDKIVPFSQF